MNCGKCHYCLDGVRDGNKLPITLTTMILCSICGNKRCPHATDHRLACNGSNDPNQPGSIYSNFNFKTVEE